MKKRLPVLLLALVMLFSISIAAIGCDKKEESKPKLKVWSMSNEVVELLKYHTLVNPNYKYDFDITFINNDDGSYETALDNAFASKGGPDLFLTDVDYTKKYVNSDHSEDLSSYYKTALNLGDSNYSTVRDALEVDMYGYTLDLGTLTGTANKLKAVSYQVTPGAMFYRADMFLTLVDNGLIEGVANFAAWKTNAGLSSTATIANYKDWSEADKQKVDAAMQAFVGDDMNGFYQATKAVAQSAYNTGKDSTKKILMVNNLEDIKRVFYASRDAFVNGNNIVIDNDTASFLEYAKNIYGYTHKGSQWGDSWTAGMKAQNTATAEYKTMAFFLPTWGLFYVLKNDETAGLWRMVEGPQAYYWGGTYGMVNAHSKNKQDAFDVLNFITSLNFMQARSAFSGDVMNSKGLNSSLASMGVLGNDFLGGQNHFATFNTLANDIDASNVTQYDSTVDRIFSDVVKRYANEEAGLTAAKAWQEIKQRLESDMSGKTFTIPTPTAVQA
jgi:hypothetical protein